MHSDKKHSHASATRSEPPPAPSAPRPASRPGPEPAPGPDASGLNLELLVHGVGGTTPDEMLDAPFPERVTGDATAAVYRRGEDMDAEARPGDYTDKPVPEAYSWCNLTSGNGARALWLLLLPFMVANLAHWMRPAAGGSRKAVRVHGVLVRLLSLSLTVLLVAAACEVALDLVAWQCAGASLCVADHSWLGFMAADRAGNGGWWSQPGRRLALAALLPVALTVLLWWLSHRTWSAYESQPPLQKPIDEDDCAADGRPALCLPGFWYGKRLVARLRAAHTAAGFLTVAAALTAATTRHDGEPGGSAALNAAGWAIGLLAVAGALCVLYVVCSRGRKESSPDDRVDELAVRALPGASVAVLVLAVGHALWSRPGWVSAGGELPGDETFGVIAVLQGALVVALGALGLLLYSQRPVARTALKGLGSASVAMLACGLGGIMSGGVAQRMGDWLDGGSSTPGMRGAHLEGPPTVLSWQASVIPLLLAAVLVLVCWFGVHVWRQAGALTEDVERGYPGVVPDATRSRRIAGAVSRAGLTDSAPWLVGTVALITLLLGGLAVLGAWTTGEVPGRAADGLPAIVDGFAETVQALGSWLIGFAFLLLLTWGRRAYRDPSARRTIGILWDVGTFWPRAAHPFAPPCYAERAVPDLAWRIGMWTQQTGGRLVLSGHSQGSVLSAAAIWQLDPVTRRHVALLTYGSPLERLYGRWFPAYFGPQQLRDLHRELDCWRNLWRFTDPIGGPVRLPNGKGPDVDRGPLLDPLAYGRTVEQPLPAPILGHGEYQADPAFGEERDRLLARLRERRPVETGLCGVPRQPERSASAADPKGAGTAEAGTTAGVAEPPLVVDPDVAAKEAENRAAEARGAAEGRREAAAQTTESGRSSA
ncbi:hypothetical protein [Streptomyces daliensis]